MNYSILSHSVRKLFGSALVAIVSVLVAGCSDDNPTFEKQEVPESGYINLSLKCIAGTRAEGDYTENGSDPLNENKISKVTICLWSDGGDKPDDTAKPDYVQTFEGVNRNYDVKGQKPITLRIPLTPALKRLLFESEDGKCNAFAAVNVDPPAGEFTIAEFRSKTIDSEFPSKFVQEDFAMDGDCVVTYDRINDLAKGEIDLRRSASKIMLALNVDKIVDQTIMVDGELKAFKWTPDTTKMRVWLIKGLAEATLDPNLEDTPVKGAFFDTSEDKNYEFIDSRKPDGSTPDNGNNPPQDPNDEEKTMNYPFVQRYPFYTYPHRWKDDPNDETATYMQLAIPWVQVKEKEDGSGYEQIEGSSWRTCYYQVPVIAANSDPLQLVRNVSYHVYLHVGILGSFVPDEPLVLNDELEYSAAEWGNVDMDVSIPDVRYLVVDQNDYTVNNESSIVIPFYTSHKTIVTNAIMTFYRYNFDDAGLERAVTVSMEQNEESKTKGGEPVFTAEFNNTTKELIVTHELKMYEAFGKNDAPVSFTDNDGPNKNKNDRSPKTDADWKSEVLDKISYFKKIADNEFSRVEFKITLRHEDINQAQPGSHNFEEVITITQYPGIYITAVTNYYGGSPELTSFGGIGAQGNALINGYYINRNGDNKPSKGIPLGWTSSIGLSSSYFNFNPNMYLVTVTTLPEGTPYSIGDPRSLKVNNYLESSEHSFDPTSELGRSPNANNFYGSTNPYSIAIQERYVKALITKGVNSQLSSVAEDLTHWAETSYSWYHWTLPKDDTNKSHYYIDRNSSGSVTVTGFESQVAIYPNGASRNLRYYYPTLEDDAHKMMIAPKFRICSSYAGTTWILNRELARRRAAAYQEMGYAAGRWRLPTFGEVQFIMELAATYKIPRLFGTFSTTWWYWCAQGLVCVPSKSSGKSTVSLPSDNDFELPLINGSRDCQRARFVYDEWYWGEADLKDNGSTVNYNTTLPIYTFTWGDRPF